MVRDLAADLRRPGRPDRGHAAHPGRREALDRPAAVPVRAVLLHPAARPGGPAARHLRRLAAQRRPGRPRRRDPLHPPRRRRPARALRRSTSPSATPRWSRRCSSGWRRPSSPSSSRPSSASAGKGLGHPALVGLAVASFVALTFFAVPFPVVIGRRRARRLGARARPSPTCTRPRAAARGRRPARRSSATTPCTPSARPVAAPPSSSSSGSSLWFAPVALAAAAVRRSQHLRRPGPVLLRRGGRHLRRRVRRPRLRRPAGRQRLRLAGPGRDGARPRPRRDHPRAR